MATQAVMTVSDISLLIPARGTVIAVTDDGSDPRFAAVREAATAIAAVGGGRVLLFHSPAMPASGSGRAPRMFLPAASPDGAGRPHTGSRKQDLLSREAADIHAHGVDVAVWLSGLSGAAGVAEAVALTGATAVLMPAEAARPRVINLTLAYRATRIPAIVIEVGVAGRLTRVEPLRGSPAEADGRASSAGRPSPVAPGVAAFAR